MEKFDPLKGVDKSLFDCISIEVLENSYIKFYPDDITHMGNRAIRFKFHPVQLSFGCSQYFGSWDSLINYLSRYKNEDKTGTFKIILKNLESIPDWN